MEEDAYLKNMEILSEGLADNTEECIERSYLECLEKYFGHKKFRPMQWKIISNILLNKKDVFAVMATGYGKSLCFQFPSVYLNAVTIVVSPLISLMEDQVLSLKVSNIRACLLGTAQKDKQILNNVLNFEYNLVYVTPEMIISEMGNKILQALYSRLLLIAIDEAHCISKWGHDFRSAFRKLNSIRSVVPKIPILAVTATATEKVKEDICKCLRLRNPIKLLTGFDRPNLEFNVQMKSNDGIWSDIESYVKSVEIGSIIIYCLTRKDTESVADVIKSKGINCQTYHAGLTIKQRSEAHENFVKDKVKIIVATIAFGMGIDKPDIRLVIHYGASKDLESYYQEVGRAGRDGLPSKCFMLYNYRDFHIHRVLRESTNMPKDVEQNLEVLSKKMREFVETNNCRRIFILKYFNGDILKISPRQNCCDNCRNSLNPSIVSDKFEDSDEDGYVDFTIDARNLLGAIEAFDGKYGLQMAIAMLRGSKQQKLDTKFYSHKLYGAGKNKPMEWYKLLAELLETENYLGKQKIQKTYGKIYHGNQTTILTEKGRIWLKNAQTEILKLKPNKAMFAFLKVKSNSQVVPIINSIKKLNPLLKINSAKKEKNFKEDLLRNLLMVRGRIATQLDVMPYMIASNQALNTLVEKQPDNLNVLKCLGLDGFSDVKINKFGPEFIKCILQAKNSAPMEPISKQDKIINILKEKPITNTKIKLTDTHFQTYELWTQGKNVKEIASLRGLSENTVANYMNKLIKTGYCCTIANLRKLQVDDYHFRSILSNLPLDLSGDVSLKSIKEKCVATCTYDMINYVLSYHQVREHLKKFNISIEEQDNDRSELKDALNVTEENGVSNTSETDNLWGKDVDIDFDIQNLSTSSLHTDSGTEINGGISQVGEMSIFETEKEKEEKATQASQESRKRKHDESMTSANYSNEEKLSRERIIPDWLKSKIPNKTSIKKGKTFLL